MLFVLEMGRIEVFRPEGGENMSEKSKKVFVIQKNYPQEVFSRASTIMAEMGIDTAVLMGNIVKGPWRVDTRLYNYVFRQMQKFIEKHNTYFCYGDLEMAYLMKEREAEGYNPKAELLVWAWLLDLRRTMKDRIAYAHRIGNCLFSYAGITSNFLEKNIPNYKELDIDAMIDIVNGLDFSVMWTEGSPLLAHPDSPEFATFISEKHLQVTGNTPIKCSPYIVRENFLLTDTFSTYADGKPFGTEEFVVVDTEDLSFETVKA